MPDDSTPPKRKPGRPASKHPDDVRRPCNISISANEKLRILKVTGEHYLTDGVRAMLLALEAAQKKV